MDDLALFHLRSLIVFAALAAAQHRGAIGRALLVSMLAGGEVMNRLSLAINPALRDRGFYTTSVVSHGERATSATSVPVPITNCTASALNDGLNCDASLT